MTHAPENENEIVLQWKQGRKRAYEMLVRHYMTDAFLVALGFVGNREDARDLSQDAFIKAYKARDSFEQGRPFYPWLYRILKNHCLNFIKRRGQRQMTPYDSDNNLQERIPSGKPSALDTLEAEERCQLVRNAVNMLSEDHREIIVLKNFKGHSYQEIADLLEIPMGTVMSRLYYARKALKRNIELIQSPEEVVATGARSRPTGEVA